MAELTPIPPNLVPICDTRVMTPGWYMFLQSLFRAVNAIVTGSLVYSVSSSLTATGASQGTALLLASDWSRFSTVALGTGCRLADSPGQSQSVINDGANPLRVYPPSGASIDALGPDIPYVLAVGKTQVFNQLTATIYRSTQLG